jgi:hypothetical protein
MQYEISTDGIIIKDIHIQMYLQTSFEWYDNQNRLKTSRKIIHL